MLKYFALWRLAYKNTYRNNARQKILISVWVFGTIAILFASSFVKGLVNQRIAERIDTSLGHIKITHKSYNTDKSTKFYLNSTNKILENIFEKNDINYHTTRLNVRGLCLKKNQKNQPKNKENKINEHQNIVDIYGILPESETKIFALHSKIILGKYLEGENNNKNTTTNQIIIGNVLAKKENIKLNDTLVIQYFSKEKNIIKRLYIVCGIFTTSNENFDKTHIFTHKNTWREFAKDDFHQLIFRLKNHEKSYIWAKKQTKISTNPTLQIKSWQQISPDLAYLYEMMRVFFDFFLALILSISALGILQIFVVMAQERKEECSKMRDLGISKFDLCLLFGFEGLIFLLKSLPYNILLLGLMWFWGIYWGVDLSWFGEAMHKWGNASNVYLEISFLEIIKLFSVQILTAFLVGFFVMIFQK